MPARIYALAKELNLDSKDLVDLVKKVGITGKGSALASLTDEEAQKVRDHLTGSAPAAAPKAQPTETAAPAAVRDSVVPVERKQIAIPPARTTRKPALASRVLGKEKPVEAEEEVAVVNEEPVVESQPAEEPVVVAEPDVPESPAECWRAQGSKAGRQA